MEYAGGGRKMPVWDSGLVLNRGVKRTKQITISLMNRGWLKQRAGIQVYTLNGEEDGFADVGGSPVKNVMLHPSGIHGSAYTVEEPVDGFSSFGVRIGAVGPGAEEIVVSLTQFAEDGEIIASRKLDSALCRLEEPLLAFAANHTQHTVTVIHAASNTQAAVIRLPEGSLPRQLAVSPDGTLIGVTCQGDKTLKWIDGVAGVIEAELTFPEGAVPFAIAVSPVSGKAYVTTLVEEYAAVIDMPGMTLVKLIALPAGSDPSAITITPDGRRAYCCLTNMGANESLAAMIRLPQGSRPTDIASAPDGVFVYVTDAERDCVYVLRTALHAVCATIRLEPGSAPQHIAITPDGALAYISCRGLDAIEVVNCLRKEFLTTIELPKGSGPAGLAVSPDGSKVYAAMLTFGYVAVIDVQSHMPIAIVPAGSFPSSVAVAASFFK
jgi:DNA-binding beta-propeller fold protein YncE